MVPGTGSNLGFLAILHEAGGHIGGYLVTNQWGRPLEFRLSTAVQPNRVQQILYADTLLPYICGDLIGKTLMDKTTTPAQFIITDTAEALDLRLKLETPVLWLAPPEPDRPKLRHHPRFQADAAAAQSLLEKLDGSLDLGEPFTRIREAIGEARRMGVMGRN